MSITLKTNLESPYILIKPDVTFKQYIEWCDEDSRAELLEGELIMNSPASFRHEDLQVFLSTILNIYVSQKKLGKILGSQFTIRFDDKNGLCPDLMFISNKNLKKVKSNYIDGAPDFVLEILSPSDRPNIMKSKKEKYLNSGVLEYWLVNPNKKNIIVYKSKSKEMIHIKGKVKSTVIKDFWIKAEWLWKEPLPDALQCLQEILKVKFVKEN